MKWRTSHKYDREALPLADRHYSRQKPGTPQFVPPGRSVVLVAGRPVRALWVSLLQLPEWTKHAWPGAWMCSLFRNEGAGLSSELVREAIAATRWVWGDPPAVGMVTFVDAGKVRRKRDPGRCFLRAGFKVVGRTKDRGLHVLQLMPDAFPAADQPIGLVGHLWSAR